MRRKERMHQYAERIYKLLSRLPATQANEIECKAMWDNVALSHLDIANKIMKCSETIEKKEGK